MKQAFNIVMVILIIFSVISVGYYIIKDAKIQENKYNIVVSNINEAIKPNTSQAEIHDIIEIHCQSIMDTESDVYQCITRYEIEN